MFAPPRVPPIFHPRPPIRAFVPSSLTRESPKITRTAVCGRRSVVGRRLSAHRHALQPVLHRPRQRLHQGLRIMIFKLWRGLAADAARG